MPQIEIAADTFEMMQADAQPLVDTADTIIKRWGMFYREHKEPEPTRAPGFKVAITYPGHVAPSLRHTKVVSAEIDGMKLPKGTLYWNALLDHMIVRACDRIKSAEQLRRLILVNHVQGRKEDTGYHYIEKANVSVQGQDSDAAWKAVYHIGKYLDLTGEVMFVWAHKEGAARPGEMGILRFDKQKSRRAD
jgi:hypothetical protein